MTPYEQIADLAADLRRDGFSALNEGLLQAHRGIFNGTELYMAWRFHVAKVLEEPGLSNPTKAKAQRLWVLLDKELS
jgi:hypothetical protein